MKCTCRSGLVAGLVAGLLGLVPGVQAQFNFNPNMNPSFISGLTQAQYMAFLQQAAAARALQDRLDTKKKKFDLEMYIKANTPTFTEEQAKVLKMTLKRIQTNSTEPEIVNGRALNLLLDDMRRYPGKKDVVEPYALSE